MNPLVSVVIPAYNAEPFLAETVRSVIKQTWTPIEIVIVDDGSKDGTLAVADQFAGPSVKVVAQPNAGASAARNRGVAEAQGEFIQYLDADDLLAPSKVTVQMRRLLAEGPEVLASGRWSRFADDTSRAWTKPEPFWADCDPIDWLVSCWERNSMMHPAAWLLSRQLIDRAGPWDERLTLDDDGEYFARVVLASRRVIFCGDAQTYYRSGVAPTLSGSRSPRAWRSQLDSVQKTTDYLLAREDSPRTRRACVRRIQEFVYAAYPECPELLAVAEKRVHDLGGPQFAPQGGRLFRSLCAVVGWRLARRLQRAVRRGRAS